ncbi:MAG: DUF2721 domain-containing protein [Sphingobacteriia bacterium]|nr:DUF2721 domain-containing protein [Sphingobacteriia bacterium]
MIQDLINIQTVDLIQAMLAPGIMISACGLLLLGINNKYSIVVNRIRVLEEEKRKLAAIKKESNLNEDQLKRLNSINLQITKFAYRIGLVRNAVLFYTLAVGFFILASLSIGSHYFLPDIIFLSPLAIVFFSFGMLSVFAGIGHAAKEILKGYQIVMIEISESEI